jgi:hypothetical protein
MLESRFPFRLGNAAKLAGDEFARTQPCPEVAVLGAFQVHFVHKQAVIPTLDFAQPIADRFEEVLVGCNDCAVQLEFDNRLRFADRRQNGPACLCLGSAAFSTVVTAGFPSFFWRGRPVSPEEEVAPF